MLILVLFVLFITNVLSQEVTLADAKKISIKQLKIELKKRGLECKGCAEKEDFVDLFLKNQHLEAKDTPIEEPKKEDPTEDSESQKTKEIEDILEKLKKSGMGGAKMFTKADLEKMGEDGMMNEFGGNGKDSKRNKKGKSAKKSKTKPKTEDVDEVEL